MKYIFVEADCVQFDVAVTFGLVFYRIYASVHSSRFGFIIIHNGSTDFNFVYYKGKFR